MGQRALSVHIDAPKNGAYRGIFLGDLSLFPNCGLCFLFAQLACISANLNGVYGGTVAAQKRGK